MSAPRDIAKRLAAAWNDMAKPLGLPHVISLTSARVTMVSKCLQDDPDMESNFVAALDWIREIPFLRGENDRDWRVYFDWMLMVRNGQSGYGKILEGKYGYPPPKPKWEIVRNAGPWVCSTCSGKCLLYQDVRSDKGKIIVCDQCGVQLAERQRYHLPIWEDNNDQQD